MTAFRERLRTFGSTGQDFDHVLGRGIGPDDPRRQRCSRARRIASASSESMSTSPAEPLSIPS